MEYQVLFEHLPVPLLVVARDSCKVLAANAAAAQYYGYSVDRLLDASLSILFHPQDWPQAQQVIQSGGLGLKGGMTGDSKYLAVT